MQDLDFRMADDIRDLLKQYAVPYKEDRVGGLIYFTVVNNDMMVLFIMYGFFEEYVLYEKINDDWVLKFRNEFNFAFNTLASVLYDIGIYV